MFIAHLLCKVKNYNFRLAGNSGYVRLYDFVTVCKCGNWRSFGVCFMWGKNKDNLG